MEREILVKKLMEKALAKPVSRRDLPKLLLGLSFSAKSFLELQSHELALINFKVEFREWVEPLFVANQTRLRRLIPNGILGDIDSLAMYYFLYRFAQDAYQVKWYALWLIHGHESTCSKDKNAFNRGRLVVGAMQRTVSLYPDSQVEETARGYEFLANFPQRHPTDWKEILWAAEKLDKDARATVNADKKDRHWAIGDAIARYSPDGNIRRASFEVLYRIFG